MISFIVDNYEEIFTADLKPAIVQPHSSLKPSPSQLLLSSKLGDSKKATVTKKPSSESIVSSSSRSNSDSDSDKVSGGMIVDPFNNSINSNNTPLHSGSNSPSGYTTNDSFNHLQRSGSGDELNSDVSRNFRKSLSLVTPLDSDALSLDIDFESSHGANVPPRNQLSIQNYTEQEWKVLFLSL